MAKNQVLKFEGDLRAWLLNPTSGDKTPIIPDAGDIYGNIPLEASAQVFGYEAGEERRVVSKRRDRYNATIYAEQEPGESTMEVTLVAVPPAIVARVFYGESAVINVVGAAFSDVPVTFSADALTQPIGTKRYIDANPTVENVAGDVTYVAGVDYVIDRRLGRIRRVVGGAITATGEVRVTGTETTYQLVEIRGGVKPQETLYLLGDYKNRPDGSDMYLEVYQWNASTDGEMDLFSEEPITVTLTGPLITPEDKTEAYKVLMKAPE